MLDGVSLLPLLQGETIPPRPLFWYMPLYDLRWAATPCAVIRDGDWKLIESFGDSFDASPRYREGHRLELFNLRDDIGETRDLATIDKQRAAKMSAQLHTWMQSIPAPVPGLNPFFDAKRKFEETNKKVTR